MNNTTSNSFELLRRNVNFGYWLLAIGYWLLILGAQSAVGQDLVCGTDAVSLSPSDNDPDRDEGLYKPAFGQIHALVVFARFPDDTTHYSPNWDKMPSQGLETWMENFIDPTTTPSNERYNLTSFFREESFGNLIMTGDVYHFLAPNASSSYSTIGTCYGAANRDLLEALHDSVAIDDSKFDQWSYDGVGNHINTPDGVYDLIVVIWRRSSSFWFASCSGQGNWSGIARLGGSNFTIGDLFVKPSSSPQNETVNGITVNASPSGVTNYGYGPSSTHQIVVHEIAHILVSQYHPYYNDSRNHSFYSSFGNDENTSSFNAYEKDMLGWITPTDITSVTSPYSISLKDAASHGEALKFHVGNDEWFYIENRQGGHFGGVL